MEYSYSSILCLWAQKRCHNTQHNDTDHKGLIFITQHNNTPYYNAECGVLLVVMLNAVMLSVVILNVVMLSVMAPQTVIYFAKASVTKNPKAL